MNYFDDYDSDPKRWPKVLIACVVGAAAVGSAVWFLTRPGDEQTGSPAPVQFDRQDSVPPSTRPGAAVSTGSATATGARSATTAPEPARATTTAPAAGPVAVSLPTTSSTVLVSPPTSPSAPTSPSTSSTTATSSTPSSTTAAATVPSPSPDGSGPYPTSPDGTPLPVIVTYDVDTIMLTGLVPSQAAKDRLAELAIANSKTDAQLENNLVINPAVPIGVGVRVIELNSVRFPQGSSEILPEHATELERVARVMQALPNVTVLVIGHADQRGDEAENFELSAARAEAVVEFLTYYGVSPTRLSSRAVGEADLLTLDDDDTALALNRRTEFIFYGLLIE